MGETEEVLAELADVAYQVLLRNGLRGSFLEVELELWRALRAAYYQAALAPRRGLLAEAV
jgi:hypothetical protein